MKEITKQGLIKLLNNGFIIGWNETGLLNIKNLFNLSYSEDQKEFIVEFAAAHLFNLNCSDKTNFKNVYKRANKHNLDLIKYKKHFYFININKN